MKRIAILVAMVAGGLGMMNVSAKWTCPTDEELIHSTQVVPDGTEYINLGNFMLPKGFCGTLIFPESIKTIKWDDWHPYNSECPRPDHTYLDYERVAYHFAVLFFKPGSGMTVVCKAIEPPQNNYFVESECGWDLGYEKTPDIECRWDYESFTLYVPDESIDKYKDESLVREQGTWVYPNLWAKYGTILPLSEFKDETMSVEEVEEDADVPAEYYNLEGMKLPGYPQQNGIYVERRGDRSRKIMITNL